MDLHGTGSVHLLGIHGHRRMTRKERGTARWLKRVSYDVMKWFF
jgi:hypothetical protein